jgi:STE24 endopeptidase
MAVEHRLRAFVVLLLLSLCIGITSAAEVAPELPPGTFVPDATRPASGLDVEKATQAYLALLTPEQRARSDAYFEGGYWLQLWQFLYTIAVLALVLWRGWAASLRDWAGHITKHPPLQTALYVLLYVPMIWLLTLPLSWYSDFVREHQYGMSNQEFGNWLWDDIKGLIAVTILAVIALVGIYAMVRRAGRRAWLWASGFVCAFFIFLYVITPVFLAPVFNDYQPLEEGPTRSAVLSLARANGIPVTNLKWFDASKQTKRVSANVSGLFGTTQVSLNDNLLKRTSLPEIKAVLGHEMGHYVLHHSFLDVLFYTVLFGVGFLILDRAIEWVLPRWGQRLRIASRGDLAGLPFAIGVLTVYLFLATPIINRFVYTLETEADLFGLNASREPYGFATVAMRLGAYRKLEPSKLEELLFYDHPSGRKRVEMAMQWLKENQPLFEGQTHEITVFILTRVVEPQDRATRSPRDHPREATVRRP